MRTHSVALLLPLSAGPHTADIEAGNYFADS